jgi:Zn-dependent M28 family amino/carboxypeptidase
MSQGRTTIDPERFNAHVRTLSSDAFEGRAPGSAGEGLTVEYLSRQFQALGLEPGTPHGYAQAVPMLESRVDPATALELRCGQRSMALAFGSEMVIGSTTGEREIELDDSELVFAGYGIVAPEHDWNDYAGIDVRGKTVVLLVNDPGFQTGDPHLFNGRRMTPYGRWPYKFAEAARQGAAAALIVHEDAAAGYGWGVVESGAIGPRFSLPTEVDPAPRLPLQGWLSAGAAARLFEGADVDLDEIRRRAAQPGFRAVPMPVRLSTTVSSEVRSGQSCNVLGAMRGRRRPDEVVVCIAHWDHFGRKPDVEGSGGIRAGAIDNGTGVAAILEIARMFTMQPHAPERSVVFAAVTLEEFGLLGSQYLVSHLPWALSKTVAVLNFDALDPDFDNREQMPLVGYGSSTLEDSLATILTTQGRRLADEPEPEKGLFFRSDHYSFATAGVPGLVIGLNLSPDYMARRYHQPADVYRDDWDLTGVLLDVEAMYRLGDELANGSQWPQWYSTHPFRTAWNALHGAED